MKIAKPKKEIEIVKQQNYPQVIQENIDQLKDLGGKVEKAMEAAKNARGAAGKAKKEVGLFNQKTRIEDLQSSQVELADAVVANAEAHEISFAFQQKLAKITRGLFEMGISNMAANRTVVRQLELKLRNASKEELSELVRKEIESVIRQLKAQEDVWEKIKLLFDNIKEQEGVIKDNSENIDALKKSHTNNKNRISKLEKRSDEYEKKLVNTISTISNNFIPLSKKMKLIIIPIIIGSVGILLGIINLVLYFTK
jgi:hypothetical protein